MHHAAFPGQARWVFLLHLDASQAFIEGKENGHLGAVNALSDK